MLTHVRKLCMRARESSSSCKLEIVNWIDFQNAVAVAVAVDVNVALELFEVRATTLLAQLLSRF